MNNFSANEPGHESLRRQAYVDYGYNLDWSFTPLSGKQPTLKGWQKRDRETLEDALAWAAKGNVGLRTGKASNGLIVIDVDEGGDVSALEFPDTVTVVTGGRGRHYYFHCSMPLGNSAGKLGLHIDVRGDGGQVVYPGSVHPKTGNLYDWVEGHEPWNIKNVAELPQWIFDKLAKPKAAKPSMLADSRQPKATNYAQMALKLECEAVAKAIEGERNETLNRASFNMGTLIGGGHIGRSEVETALLVAAEACGLLSDPDDGEVRTRDTIRSGVEAGMQQPRRVEAITAVEVPALPAHRFKLDLYGNADRFMHLFGQDVHWSEERGKWYAWNDCVWNCDAVRKIPRMAELTIRAMLKEAADSGDEKSIRWAIRCNETSRARTEMLDVVKHRTAIRVDEFDRDPWLLGVKNGVVDLKTGELLPHCREQMISVLCPTTYAPDVPCPRWEQFLVEIMDGDTAMIEALQRMAGYFLTGDISVQILPIFYGSGSNGKNVLLDTLMGVMGPYATEAPDGLLTTRKNDEHPTEIAGLCGKRLVVASETEEGRRMRIGLVKKLTGNKYLKARFMRQDYFQFERTHKTVMVTNNKPVITEVSNAIWRRLRLIPFEVTIPEDKQDKRLTENLMAEWPGILAWAVRGCLAWQQDQCDLSLPKAVSEATDEYRSDSDPVGQFIQERCVVMEGVKVSRSSLYQAYDEWARQAGEYVLSGKAFTSRMRNHGIDDSGWMTEHGKSHHVRAWSGIALAGPAEEVPGQWD